MDLEAGMGSFLLAVIYLIFISLGLPDSLLGSGWPRMQLDFGVPSSCAGFVSMTISFMTIISALVSPRLIRAVKTQWIVIASIGLQMASAYVGSTVMPMVFGLLQHGIGIWIMPIYLTVFAALNVGFLELTYRKLICEESSVSQGSSRLS